MEGGLQLSQGLQVGVLAWTLVLIESGAERFLLRLSVSSAGWRIGRGSAKGIQRQLQGNDLGLKASVLHGLERFTVALEGKLVLLLAGDAVLAGQVFGRQSHVEVDVRIGIHQLGVGREMAPGHGDQAHAFRSSGEDDLGRAAADSLGGEGDRLEARSAEAVDGDGRDIDRQTGPQCGDSGHVHSLLRLGHGAPHDDVFDFAGLQSGSAPYGFRDGRGSQVVGSGVSQGALSGFPDGSPDGADDYSLLHGSALSGSDQFLSGLPRSSMCWIRSCDLRSPQTLRKASLSRSRKCCSLTVFGLLQSPPQRIWASLLPIW